VAKNNEEIAYSSVTTDAAHTAITLLGVERCKNIPLTPPITAAANDPVATLTADGTTPDFETEVISTGIANGAQRTEYKTVQR
jgi:hypothetical protein